MKFSIILVGISLYKFIDHAYSFSIISYFLHKIHFNKLPFENVVSSDNENCDFFYDQTFMPF